jgi:hypothetical protein
MKRNVLHRLFRVIPIALSVFCGTAITVRANTRTLETRFALSGDARSEFSKQFPVLSAGRVLVEANWNSINVSKAAGSLTLVLIQPDGTTVTRHSGTSALRLEHRISQQDIEKFEGIKEPRWTVKIQNNADSDRSEVAGTLRITVPAASRALEDTLFTLLGSGNAQEIPFNVPAPGKVQVDVSWETDDLARPSAQVALVVSFIHPGESKTYARRQGPSVISVAHQVTEQSLDLGSRWVVRVQNDTQTKVTGRVRITYTPSL